MKNKHISLKKTIFIIITLISFLLIIFTLGYSLSVKFTKKNIDQTSLKQQNQSDIEPQSQTNDYLNDLKLGGGNQINSSLSNEPITLSDGSYVITTNIGITKLSPFGTFLYSYSFTNLAPNTFTDSFENYKTRQVVQNYLDPSLFYLLIYSPDVTIDTSADQTTWKNPGYVLTIKDSGSDFSLLNTNALLLPVTSLQLLSYVIFSPTLVGPGTTDAEINNITNLGSTAPTFTGKWIAPTDDSKKAPGINYDKNVVSNLYLNNLNNMVFIDGGIFIFGGNNLPNFWFWNFKTNDSINKSFSTIANLYLNKGITWPTNAKYDAPNIIDGSNSLYYLRFHDGGKGLAGWDVNGQYSYPSFFVSGAKTIAQNHYANGKVVSTSYSVQALFVLPGFVYLQKDSRLQSAFLNVSYLGARKAYYFLLSMDSTRANSINNGSTTDKLFNKSTFGIDSTSLDFSSTVDPDGYINSLTNKVYGFDIETIPPSDGNGLDAVNALLFLRDSFVRIIYDPNSLLPMSTPKYDDSTVQLAKEYKVPLTSKNQIYQSNTQEIIFNKNVWYLLINNGNFSQVISVNLSGSYVPDASNNEVSQPNNISLSFESINAPQGSQIVGLLPVSDNFIYALTKDQTTSNVTVNLFQRNSLNSPYLIDNAYVYKPTLPTYSDNSLIWGTITLKDNTYLNNAGYFSQTAVEIANDPQKLQNIISFTPAWQGQIARVSAPDDIKDLTKLPVTINIEYFNNKFYNNQSFNQSLNFPDLTLTGLSSTPSWVLPVAVGVSVGVAAIIIILGLAFGIPMAKQKKLQDKGFSQTLKKVDTLTAAVGSVYKKIATQTIAIKQKPQLLKEASKPVARPTAPVMTNQITNNMQTVPFMTYQIPTNRLSTPVMTNQIVNNMQTAPIMTNQIPFNRRQIAPPRRPVWSPKPPQRQY